MDIVVKYEVTHFVDDARKRQYREDKKRSPANQKSGQGKPSKEKISFRGRGRFKLKSDTKHTESRKRATTSVNAGPDVAESVTRTSKIENISLNVLCEKPLVYKSRPLFSVTGAINVSGRSIASQHMLLDCGATTTYVSKRWVEQHQLQTAKFGEKNILVKLGDNQIIETELEVLPLDIMVSGIHEAYKCIAVVFLIHDEFDCILGIPFFEDMQPQIDWRSRRIEGTGTKTLRWERIGEAFGSIEEGGPVIASGLRRFVEAKGLSAKRPDSCRGAALETDVTSAAKPVRDIAQDETPSVVHEQRKDAPTGTGSVVDNDKESSGREGTAVEAKDCRSARGKDSVVENMFTVGVVDESGV
ncbi:hypothetical protein PC117_g16345 [Phytophthora cactorum]|uniref:Aspartic peptidase domain n=3 Tax=Phytophthora cactorum TaxID=29920 RepID=A0A8T1CDE1_9STRA|nr:hypothetical protein PC117_g16345 [Phytophthora cactorum]